MLNAGFGVFLECYLCFGEKVAFGGVDVGNRRGGFGGVELGLYALADEGFDVIRRHAIHYRGRNCA